MATKKQYFLSPIGTFNYPWLDKPSVWKDSARDGKGGSVPALPLDINARYSVNLNIVKKVFEASDFKKDIDKVWKLAQEQYKGRYDETREPYSKDDDGNYVLKPSCRAAFMNKESGKVSPMAPTLKDCDSRDITEFIKNEDISVASGSVGRVKVTTYVGEPSKSRQTGKMMLSMKLDLKMAQFKRLDRYEGSHSDEPIEDGVPVAEDYGESIPI
jgi:hypothetical protein